MCRIDLEVGIDGAHGVDDNSACAADARGVGAVAAKRLDVKRVCPQQGSAQSTLRWWWRVFRAAGAAAPNGGVSEQPVRFTEVPPPAHVPGTTAVVEIVLPSG